jgi:hypothetical protein
VNKKVFVAGTILFALFAIWVVNRTTGMTYDARGSFDIITGALVETFVLTVFFQYFGAKSERKMEDRLQKHLDKIEQLEKERMSGKYD